MENEEIIRYQGQLQKVKNAISVTNKLLAMAEPLLIPYRKGNKWGYCTADKKIIIECIYDYCSCFFENRAAVKLNGKWGYINNSGSEVIEIKYLAAGDFCEGLAWVRSEHIGYECINESGVTIIPNIYELDYERDFTEGLACVKLNDKYGYIDKLGNVVIPFIYDYGYTFSEGLACVGIDEKYGYIDKGGNLIIPFIYEAWSFGYFREGLSPVKLNGKCGYIDTLGNQVIPIEYEDAFTFNEGLACIKEFGTGFQFINHKGEVAFPNYYSQMGNFSEGLAAVGLLKEWLYINKKGDKAFSTKNLIGSPFINGFALLSLQPTARQVDSRQIGYIDKQGNQYWEE